MKKKAFAKLSVKKTTVTNLRVDESSQLHGGAAPSVPIVACSPWCAQTFQKGCQVR